MQPGQESWWYGSSLPISCVILHERDGQRDILLLRKVCSDGLLPCDAQTGVKREGAPAWLQRKHLDT
jgi:hypothetical protein